MQEVRSGLLESVKRLGATIISIASTRLLLLANELQEERLRFTQMLLLAVSALFCIGVGLLLLTALIIIIFWEDHRYMVIGTLSVLFFLGGGISIMLLRGKSQEPSTLFTASLAQLSKDKELLTNGHIQ